MSAFFLALFLLLAPLAGPAMGAADGLAGAAELARQGRWAAAIERSADLYRNAAERGDIAAMGRALALRAEGYRALGHYEKAILDLREALGHLAARRDRAGQDGAGNLDRTDARLRAALGDVYLLTGAASLAREEYGHVRALADRTGDAALSARALNGLGGVLEGEGRMTDAMSRFAAAHASATKAGRPALAGAAAINAARIALAGGTPDIKQRQAGRAWLASAIADFTAAPDSADKARGLIAAGRLWERAGEPGAAGAAYTRAGIIAEAGGDDRNQSYALGYLGALYADAGRRGEALTLTRRALFLAERAGAPEIAYQWHRRIGRIHRAQGDDGRALAAYRAAVATLGDIRKDIVAGFGTAQATFRENVGDVLLEMVDLLLLRASAEQRAAQKQAHLVEARETLELLKTAELEDYFRDECVANLQAKVRSIDALAPGTVAIYPILLPDRAELLLSLAGGMRQVTVPVGAAQITETVRDLRRKLELRTTRQYLRPARKLYDILIRPLEPMLAAESVDTIAFIPSGALRTIPLAALHDGKQFLVQRFAVAVAPGLTLLDPRPLGEETSGALLAGLSEAVQGFSALPSVEQELDDVNRLIAGTVLKNTSFQAANLRQALSDRPYSIVHVASHAEFLADAEKSFLLTYDGKLTMDRLEDFIKLSRFRDAPVELLTLSACATAQGDDRAALGLAGIAIKAGARSALASLWVVNDEATARLISGFYQGLRAGNLSKAKALQRAQTALIGERRYRHPIYWSAFLLIGNWL